MIYLAPEHVPIIEFGLPEKEEVPNFIIANTPDTKNKEIQMRKNRSETENRRNRLRGSGRVKEAVGNALKGVSATITTGTDQSKGYTQILLALALGLFALFSFGGLFRKK